VLHTAVSDLEVISTEEQGSLWHMRYPVSDSDEVVVTFPEPVSGNASSRHSDFILASSVKMLISFNLWR
jgi:hypothetical protein